MEAHAGLSLADVEVRYEPQGDPAVHAVSFQVSPGELFVLVGPSGCGKSTALRVIAGLIRPSRGRVQLSGDVVTDIEAGIHVPPQQRHVGLVFQSYALWPHMSVEENVAFPLEARNVARPVRSDRARGALKRVGLEALASRSVTSLSGGQQQRVALARALVSDPPVLLLDEPLSNLDAELRGQMRTELRRIQREVGAAMVHVTHDREEAMEMADRLAVMRDGRIVEVGTPDRLYRRPRYAWTASLLGDGAELAFGSFQRRGEREVQVETPIGPVLCRGDDLDPPDAGRLLVRPEQIVWVGSDVSGENVFEGRIASGRFLGTRTEYRIQVEGGEIRASLVEASGGVGDRVRLFLPPDQCVPVRADD